MNPTRYRAGSGEDLKQSIVALLYFKDLAALVSQYDHGVSRDYVELGYGVMECTSNSV